MASDNQFTALGPAAVGFQTNSSNINHGAEIAGNQLGILGRCDSGNGVQGQSASQTDSGVWGENTHGGFGVSGSTTGGLAGPGGPRGIVAGVWGSNSGQGAGVRGTNSNGDGVFGEGSVGIHGTSASTPGGGVAQGWGVWGEATNGGIGVNGTTLGGSEAAGVSGFSYNTSGPAPGVWGTSGLSDGVLGIGKNGVHGQSSSATDSGVWGENIGSGRGVTGSSVSGVGVRGDSGGEGQSGVFGFNSATSHLAFGVSGETSSPDGAGVYGFSTAVDPSHPNSGGTGVGGDSVAGNGVRGHSQRNDGVRGDSDAQAKGGVFGFNSATSGLAFGVYGETVSDAGAGVYGFTATGNGVAGNSGAGYGGVFAGGRAPLRLNPATTAGAPTTGSHQKGEFFVDSNGSLFYCRADGIPGSWVKLV